MDLSTLEKQFNDNLDNIKNIWTKTVEELESSNKEDKDRIKQLKKENKELQEKYEDAQSKIDKIEDQLQNTVQQMESLTSTKAKGVDALKLLDIYLVLMEGVFESNAHTRLLIMMHGEKEEYNLKELEQAAGISPLKIKQAMFELRNSGLVEYDEEKQIAKLKTRFME